MASFLSKLIPLFVGLICIIPFRGTFVVHATDLENDLWSVNFMQHMIDGLYMEPGLDGSAIPWALFKSKPSNLWRSIEEQNGTTSKKKDSKKKSKKISPITPVPEPTKISFRVISSGENVTGIGNGLNGTNIGNNIYVRGDIFPADQVILDENGQLGFPLPIADPNDFFEQACSIQSMNALPNQPGVATASCGYTISGGLFNILLKSGGSYPGARSPDKELLTLGATNSPFKFSGVAILNVIVTQTTPTDTFVLQIDLYLD
jgi:hypothetical protein